MLVLGLQIHAHYQTRRGPEIQGKNERDYEPAPE